MEDLATGQAFSKNLDDLCIGLQMVRCQHHYIFGLERGSKPMLVLAIFHERMDLINRLKERLK